MEGIRVDQGMQWSLSTGLAASYQHSYHEGIPDIPLKLYLAITSTVIWALLAQANPTEEEALIYYVIRQLKGAETRYEKTERLCLALVYTSWWLHHYFLAHKLHLMVKSEPVRYLLTRLILSGRLARWLLQLFEFDIICVTPKAIKGQAMRDMLALFPKEEEATITKEVPGALPKIEDEPWVMHFDGSSTTT